MKNKDRLSMVMPENGGRLLPDMSAERVGFANYVQKVDWRRYLDQEITREGHDYFHPNLDIPIGTQPFPLGNSAANPVTLIHMAKRPNGEVALIVGYKTALYRYLPKEDSFLYYEEDIDVNYFFPPDLGPNLLSGSYNGSGNKTVTGLVPGKMYVWKPGAHDTSLVTPSFEYLKSAFPNPVFFTAVDPSVTLTGTISATVSGSLQQIVSHEPYYEEIGDGENTVVADGEFVAVSEIGIELATSDPGNYRAEAWYQGIRIRRGLGATDVWFTIFLQDGGLVTGDNATAELAGQLIIVQIDSGATKAKTVEAAIRNMTLSTSDYTVEEALATIDFISANYYEHDNDGAYYQKTGEGSPYFAGEAGSWHLIGSGFSENGHRWEALNLNGYVVLNNGVDLPMTYRVEESSVVPIYELRELGIAYVGTIAVLGGILLLGDIALIDEDQLESSVLAHTQSGDITAAQAGGTFSGVITATQGSGANVVATAAIFSGGMVGKRIIFSNGFTTTISAVADSTHATLGDDATILAGLDLTFYVIDITTDYTVIASANIFEASMVGSGLYWNSGEYRVITNYVNPTTVKVNGYTAVPSGPFWVENSDAYGAYNESRYISRIQYRIMWGMPDEPRRFAAAIPSSMVAGSNTLVTSHIVKSFEVGMTLVIPGADINGDNLITEIISAHPSGTSFVMDKAAVLTVEDVTVTALDAVGSIVAYDELDDDSSAIIRMAELGGFLVVYKDESIFLGRYIGQQPIVWDFQKRYSGHNTPFYRWTVAKWDKMNAHVFAGRNNWYQFDLATQKPNEIWLPEKGLFFSQVSPDDRELIFAADNQITKELFFCFPGDTHNAVCFDYLFNTFSVSQAAYTAAATINRPVNGPLVGSAEFWFVCGDANGTVLQYGRTDVPQEQWGGAVEVYHRNGQAYAATIKSGLFGHPRNLQVILGYIPSMPTQAYPNTAKVRVQLFGYNEPSRPGKALLDEVLDTPDLESYIPCMFSANYFQDCLSVAVLNTPARINARGFELRNAGGATTRWVSKSN